MRVAIVGFGPKGLFALERLLDHAHGLPHGESLTVDLFEPDPNPAAGPNYAPEQPEYLRMNFAADLIDMWWPESHAVPRSVQRSFVRWRSSANANDAYPARAEVGRYLCDGFESMLRHAPRAVTINLRATAVDELRRTDDSWDVVVGAAVVGSYDEVLVATGHAQTSPRGLGASWRHAAPLVPRVFPVERWLARDEVAPASTVAIRGFGLTFIDAALALTEGRGGSFACDGHPYRLVYEPCADQPAAILPFARTGRPMLAKPGPEVTTGVAELATIATRGRAELEALDGTVDLCHDLLPILARSASASLLATTGAEDANPDAWLADAAAGVGDHGPSGAADAIERSLEIGSGLAPTDLLWAVGHAWRALYPAIVQRLGDGGLREPDWPAFHRLAAELERVAFGPSPLNAAKLLALIEAGVVDLSLVSGASLVERAGRTLLASTGREQPVDVVVDAVLAAPGALPGQDALLDGLVARGHARIAAGRRGLDVDLDGSCRAADGTVSRGLAAIGRPTEDSVIGNDTLSRTLHPLSDRWARRVVARARVPA